MIVGDVLEARRFMDDYGQVRSPQNIWLDGATMVLWGHCTENRLDPLKINIS
jgi:hypothetical protein